MAITIKIGTARATIDRGTWTSTDRNVERFLRSLQELNVDVHAGHPDPDMESVRQITEEIGFGKIVDMRDHRPLESRDGVVY